mgnify:CR=1 FL=1
MNGKMTYTEGIDFRKSNEYIYEAGVPEKVYDNVAENCFTGYMQVTLLLRQHFLLHWITSGCRMRSLRMIQI